MLSRSQNVVAVDCQMIRVRDGEQSPLALARVSIVDFNGVVLLDAFVSPTLPVVDYRTRIHGIRKYDLDNGNTAFSFCQTMKFISPIPSGQPFVDVKQLVEGLFRGALVVGHSLELHLNVCACILNLLPDVEPDSRSIQATCYRTSFATTEGHCHPWSCSRVWWMDTLIEKTCRI
jgi:DNA polymerase III epsilon subunit-like protein